MAKTVVSRQSIDARPWTFYALGSLFFLYLLFLYGPMLVIYTLSFQGLNGVAGRVGGGFRLKTSPQLQSYPCPYAVSP